MYTKFYSLQASTEENTKKTSA